MHAIIKTGGKQYRIAVGSSLRVETVAAAVGDTVTFDQVLSVGTGADTVLGTPLVAGAKVEATVLEQGRGDKVRIFKMRRRKHYQKRQGHRQNYTEVQISAIYGAGGAELARADGAALQAAQSKASGKAAKRGQKRDGSDNLEIIEGIGPKIAQLLIADGIKTFAELAAASTERLQAVLDKAGSRYQLANPGTWPEQAALCAKGEWAAFDVLTKELDGGVRK